MDSLYLDHVRALVARYARILDASGYDGVVFHAGREHHYHNDDQHILFRSNPHFLRLAPLSGPDHLLLIRGGQAKLIRVVPQDFWYEAPGPVPLPVEDAFHVVEVADADAAATEIGGGSLAYSGNDPSVAAQLGATCEPAGLMAQLDWDRGYKSAFEVACIREAGRRAAGGHQAVRAGVAGGLSERDLHAAYLAGSGQIEPETPYGSIIGWDHAAAVLHYQTKRASAPTPGAVLLIDAGATCHGYASDITRTYITQAAHPVFVEALRRMEQLQRDLVDAVRPGASYVDLQIRTVRAVGDILADLGILRVSADEAYARRLSHAFLPHGLGHHLGLQVHDVAGHQVDPTGSQQSPPSDHPFLRTTRPLEPGQVLTVEPGLYFIDMLLQPFRGRQLLDEDLLDALMPMGGIRIEDDVLVTTSDPEDLTRPFVPGTLL